MYLCGVFLLHFDVLVSFCLLHFKYICEYYFYLTNKGDTEDTYRVNITVDVSRLKEVLDLLV